MRSRVRLCQEVSKVYGKVSSRYVSSLSSLSVTCLILTPNPQYTEFTSYAALLSGAPPSVLQRSLVAQHRQTIKVHEWHLLDPEDNDEQVFSPYCMRAVVAPLPPGNPSRAYVPDNLEMTEVPDGLELSAPGLAAPVVYHSNASAARMKGRRVRDVFLTGEVSFPSLNFLRTA